MFYDYTARSILTGAVAAAFFMMGRGMIWQDATPWVTTTMLTAVAIGIITDWFRP